MISSSICHNTPVKCPCCSLMQYNVGLQSTAAYAQSQGTFQQQVALQASAAEERVPARPASFQLPAAAAAPRTAHFATPGSA